jgi:DNA-binding NarL/FixJ family response regulator
VGVLILTVYDDEQYIYALIDAGAAGYLLKTTEATELGDAVQRVRQGEAVLSPAVTEKVLKRVVEGGGVRPVSSPLSGREREVLEFAARGASNKVIAHELELSVRTVHAHMRHIFGKLLRRSAVAGCPRVARQKASVVLTNLVPRARRCFWMP